MTLNYKLVCSRELRACFVFMIVALFSAGGIMSDLFEALVERAMAIAMPSGLLMPAVVAQECAVDCRLSAEKQRTLLRWCKR